MDIRFKFYKCLSAQYILLFLIAHGPTIIVDKNIFKVDIVYIRGSQPKTFLKRNPQI